MTNKTAGIFYEEMRQKYREFCEECKKDLDPIEAEYGGLISFEEFVESERGNYAES